VAIPLIAGWRGLEVAAVFSNRLAVN
jgi:hypothetical protein